MPPMKKKWWFGSDEWYQHYLSLAKRILANKRGENA